jgi:hypothetical protein
MLAEYMTTCDSNTSLSSVDNAVAFATGSSSVSFLLTAVTPADVK